MHSLLRSVSGSALTVPAHVQVHRKIHIIEWTWVVSGYMQDLCRLRGSAIYRQLYNIDATPKRLLKHSFYGLPCADA